MVQKGSEPLLANPQNNDMHIYSHQVTASKWVINKWLISDYNWTVYIR